MVTGGSSSGIRRKVDDLGRVVIPAGIRRSLNIREGDAVEVSVEGERVVIARPREACVFCGREDGSLRTFRNRLLCEDCLDVLARTTDRRRAATEAAVPVPDPIPPAPVPDPTPMPDPAPMPAPGPTPEPTPSPEPEPVPARTGALQDGPFLRAVDRDQSHRDHGHRADAPGADRTAGGDRPLDGDAWARPARADRRVRPAPRTRPQPEDPASTTAW